MLFYKISIPVLFLLAFAHIYTSIRNKKELGDTKLRINTEYRNLNMIIWGFIGIIWILNGFGDIKDYFLRNQISYLEDSIRALNFIALSILQIVTIYKMGQLREEGINTPFSKYKWKELKGYNFEKNKIVIYIDKKSLFTKKNKKIKWTVKKCQVDEIKSILKQHLDAI